jgi:CheY-like chemotaxis protein
MADILIIDDDEMMAEIVSELLSDEGHAVRTASDGQLGLDAIASRAPDLIVLDMNMPVMNGYAVARFLRDRPTARRTPILALTGDSTPDAIRAVREAGCDVLVPKPLDADILIASVRDLLG